MGTASRSTSIERSLEEESPFLDHEKAYPSEKRSCGLGSRTTLVLLLQASIILFLCSILVLFKALSHRPTDQECFTRLSVRCKYFPAIPTIQPKADWYVQQHPPPKPSSSTTQTSLMASATRVRTAGHQRPKSRSAGTSSGTWAASPSLKTICCRSTGRRTSTYIFRKRKAGATRQ